MDSKRSERRARRALAAHGVVAGWGWAATGFAGSALVVAGSLGLANAAVILATSAAAFAIGLWVGAADVDAPTLPIRDRWLGAGAITAVGGTFGTLSSLYRPVAPDFPWEFACLVFAVAIPAYMIGRIPPILAAHALRSHDPDEEAGPLDGIGEVVLGVIAGAVLALLIVGLLLPGGWAAGSVLMGVSISLLIPLGIPLEAGTETSEELIHEQTTALGVWRVTEIAFPGERQPERRLYLNDEEESGQMARSGVPTLPYVAAAEQWLASSTPAGADYLFLGGGAYTLPRRIAERDPDSRLVVVELDPEVTKIAQRFFGLKQHHGIRSVHGDARAFLESPGADTVDRIYVDVFGGREAIPYSLVTREAAERMAAQLKPGGLLGMNLIGVSTGAEEVQLWSIVRTFATVFSSVEIYTHLGRDYPGRQNFLLVASQGPREPGPLSIGVFDLWPRNEWPAMDDAVVFRDLTAPPGPHAIRGATPERLRAES